MLPSKDLGLNSQSLCTPCIRCHEGQRDDIRQLTDLREVTARIEGKGHGPLLPPSKDGHLPNQNLLQSVTPKTVTDRKEDKQGTPLVKVRSGRIWVAPKARWLRMVRSTHQKPRLDTHPANEETIPRQDNDLTGELSPPRIYPRQKPGRHHGTAQADLSDSQPHSDLMASFVVPTNHPTTTTCVERRTGQ